MVDKLIINADLGTDTISRHIYGHFSEHLGKCIYEGYWVGEGSPIPNVRGIRTDVVDALRRLSPPVLRWPGGCFADEYHWMDGIGPRDRRPSSINTHWGGVTEDNAFGTHEFLDLCEMLGAAPYICGNVGSGTVREMQQWVEYVTFDGRSEMADLRRANGREKPWKLPFFGVGNENWGCGGNMRAEHYADIYRRYRTYVRDLSGNSVYKIACGACDWDLHWTEVLMREAAGSMNGLSLHYYTHPGPNRSATDFGEADWFAVLRNALKMEELITRHSAIMDRYDPERRVGLIVDEWGTWYDVEPGTHPGFLYQQNTLRDALAAGVTLNTLNNACRRVRMANIAQTVNVLQAMVLTDGPRMLVTPTYHVFEMYKPHHDALMLPCALASRAYEDENESIRAVSASASRDSRGATHISLCNLDPSSEAQLECEIRGAAFSTVSGRILTSDRINDHNTFDHPNAVTPQPFDGTTRDSAELKVALPPKSVVVLELQ